MKITGSCREGTLTLRFAGELDHHSAREALDALSGRIDAFLPRTCVLDLESLSFMDSSGIALILRAEREMRNLGGQLIVKGPREQPLRVIRAAGVDKLVQLRDCG